VLLFKAKLKKISDVYESGLNKIDCDWTRNHKKTIAQKELFGNKTFILQSRHDPAAISSLHKLFGW